MLSQHGGFRPFGAAMSLDGTVQMIAGFEGEEAPTSDVAAAFLIDAFLQGASENRYKATALFSNVTATIGEEEGADEVTAVQVGLEHRDGDCVNVFLPYSHESGQEPEFQEMVAGERDAVVFVPRDDSE